MEVEDAVGDLVGSPGEHHPACLDVPGPTGGSDARAANQRALRLNMRATYSEVDGLSVPVVLPDEAVHGDGDVGRFRGMAYPRPRLAVSAAVLRPVFGCAAEDAEEHRKAKRGGAAPSWGCRRCRARSSAGAPVEGRRACLPEAGGGAVRAT